MQKKLIMYGITLFFLILLSSGCTEIFFTDDGSIRYQSHPTSISYVITYGYIVDCTGTGKYQINYELDKAELLSGSVTNSEPNFQPYTESILATYNDMIIWNITDSINYKYDLRITTDVVSQSYLLADVGENQGLSITEIGIVYPEIVNQFCTSQSDDGLIYIDPENQRISSIAQNIYNKASTDNSLIVAKELFIWLKSNTNYSYNTNSDKVKQATKTLEDEAGDCDDLSFLYISLCRALNIPARFVKGFLVEQTNAVPHAWTEVFVGGNLGNSGWIPVECAGTANDAVTEVNQNFAIETAEHLRLFTDDGSDESLNISLSGLSYKIYNQNRKVTATSSSEVTHYQVLNSKMLVIDENGKRTYE
jgi:hypothetical protein